MTCKDCIHSGLCYKENDYENFPDRCGDFISDKVLEERPQGDLADEVWKLYEKHQSHLATHVIEYGDELRDLLGKYQKGCAE